MSDREHLSHALSLAARGRGSTSPNPMVGAVVVRDGAVAGEGWHERAGGPHAETVALDAAGDRAHGATLYVSLEPCCHHGRTGPCVERIVAAGIARVVAPVRDPNPEVDGRGFDGLRRAGVTVETGLLEPEARRLNEAYLLWRARGRPFTVLKLATSLDGRIATRTGASRWITGEAAREEAHRMRALSDAVLIGSGTALADDPRLTPRAAGTDLPAPRRVVVDSALRVPPEARVLEGPGALIYTAPDPDPGRARALEERGATVVPVPPGPGGLSLEAVLRDLAERQTLSVLAEGGGRLAGSLLAGGLVDKVVWFTAPLVLGDDRARPAVVGLAPDEPDAGIRLRLHETRVLADDVMVIAYPVTDPA